MTSVLIHNIGDLVTLKPLVKEQRFTRITDPDLGRLKNAWLVIENGRVADVGTGTPPGNAKSFRHIDAGGHLVMPGLVDSHTHPLFGGSRAGEFWQRLSGATYQEIAAAGGGIQATMRATRNATDDELADLCIARLDRSLKLGVTTQEVKSGYGLTVAEEYRHLQILRRIKDRMAKRKTLSVTCLALHAASPEHNTLRAYVEDAKENLLPRVAAEGLADWVDAFIEQGYFSVEDVEPYVAKAKELGLKIRLHADEFSDAGAAEAAARWGAYSADHMQYASDAAIEKMAQAGTVATILPGTSLYTGIPYTRGERFTAKNVPVAVATDFNPGSCQIDNLAQMIVLSALNCGLKPAEALAGGTWVAAKALGLENKKGHLAPGADADLLLYAFGSLEEWFADFGRTPPEAVYSAGLVVTNV